MLSNFIQNVLDKIQGNSWGEGGVVYSKDVYERPIPFSIIIRRNNMKKAILVNDYASVEALNKLFDEGYTVESVDDRGVYILKRDEKQPTTLIACNDSMVDLKEITKAEPIKTTINLDTKAIKKSIEKTAQQIRNMKDEVENTSKQPHIRIEFDDIRDVPKVWVDGERVDSFVNGKWVSRINIDWRDNTKTINHKSFDIRYVKVDDNGANETALAQNNMA
ncbi:hypothetical protein [Leuconostoc pseudomesenteroides]|uniref:hypothetical protein n=1 Tax=Leuconostoc pseudomesenteroides TaxID=33968 RepID=UPI002898D5C6|nr:hypothetical protein [Leuconostoc pseudomesenteroides]